MDSYFGRMTNTLTLKIKNAEKNKLAGKPDSVLDSHSSRPWITPWLKQPTRFQREQRHTEPYLVLLRVGFTSPHTVASSAVRSYRTISTLPVNLAIPSAVYFLLHLPSACAAQALPGTLLCEVRTFLSPPKRQAATVWPACGQV